jgi:hypothetical protein
MLVIPKYLLTTKAQRHEGTKENILIIWCFWSCSLCLCAFVVKCISSSVGRNDEKGDPPDRPYEKICENQRNLRIDLFRIS